MSIEFMFDRFRAMLDQFGVYSIDWAYARSIERDAQLPKARFANDWEGMFDRLGGMFDRS